MEAFRGRAGFALADRADAGHRLAVALAEGSGPATISPATIVLGLCRGGVPVAATAAADLGLPLDAVATRKLGVPGHAEVAFGALASCAGHRARTTDAALVDRLLASGVPGTRLDEVVAREAAALARQQDVFLAASRPVAGRPVVLCDDGIATGATMLAAVDAVRAAGAVRVVVAVPVGSPAAIRRLRTAADAVLCLHSPHDFHAVGAYYRTFPQCTDAEVLDALAEGRHGPADGATVL
ncbi:phosphoribosyltransferase [Tersicoccus solisilvae]|uniref:Phosphoribosyltransferase n=1 Tax=Tersicoccus solisilvae TaxID=1882339 RepID=A0ABQ1P610_9MICC|nr:phosphoribosyltransferase family protein [Tersicoccus solisilvae]GGC91704.1 phosphoribosyltransferase [Tersicoccus solisilvae]